MSNIEYINHDSKEYNIYINYHFCQDIEDRVRNLLSAKGIESDPLLFNMTYKDYLMNNPIIDLYINKLDEVPYFENLFKRHAIPRNASVDAGCDYFKLTFDDLVILYNELVKDSVEFKQVTREGLYSFCINHNKSHDHIIKCMIPNGNKLAYKYFVDSNERYRYYLVNKNYNKIDFIMPIADKLFKNFEELKTCTNSIKEYIANKYGFKDCDIIYSDDKACALLVFKNLDHFTIDTIKLAFKLEGDPNKKMKIDINEYNYKKMMNT